MMIAGYFLTIWHIPLGLVIVMNLVSAVLLMRRATTRTHALKNFIGFLVCSALWAVENFFETIPGLLPHDLLVWAANASFTPAILGAYFFLQFSHYIFSEDVKPMNPLVPFVSYGFGLLGLTSRSYNADVMLLTDGLVFVEGGLYNLFVVVLITFIFLGSWTLLKKVPQQKDFSNKIKLILIFGGLITVFLMGILFMIIWPKFTGIGPYNHIAPLGILAMLFLMTWAVFRYHLFEVKIHITKANLINLVTLVVFVLGFVVFLYVILTFQSRLWVTIPVLLIFSVLFLKAKDWISQLVHVFFFNEYLDPVRELMALEPGYIQQIIQLKKDVAKFLNQFFQAPSVEIFYFNEITNDYRCANRTHERKFFAPQDPFVQFVRSTRGTVLESELDHYDFLSAKDKKIIRSKLHRLGAFGFVGMRHWTKDLVIIAFFGSKHPTREQKDKMRRFVLCSEPQWDTIASRIYANRRARQSLIQSF